MTTYVQSHPTNELLFDLRCALELTPHEAALLAGVSIEEFSRIEHGQMPTDLDYSTFCVLIDRLLEPSRKTRDAKVQRLRQLLQRVRSP